MTLETPGEQQRISRLLKNALVADRVMEDLDEEDEDEDWLMQPLNDPHEWTENLGRQLGMKDYWMYREAGAHDTLMLIIPVVEQLVTERPLTSDTSVFKQLAHEATKSLSSMELYATLLAGPPRWRQAKIGVDCKVERLPDHLKPILEKALAGELSRMFEQWTRWDIRNLEQRRKEALEIRRERAKAEAEAARPKTVRRKPSAQELADRAKERGGFFTPPGRT